MNHYPHHIGDFNKATRHLSRLERSIYRDLIDLYYDTETPLPDDVPRIARLIIASSDEEMTALRVVLEEFFYSDSGVLRNRRCDREIEKYQAFAKFGRDGAAIRWAKGGDRHPIATPKAPHAEANSNQNQNQNQNQNKAEARAARAARLPKAWILPKAWGEWAMKEQPTWDIEHTRRIGVMFRNHWVAKAGKDAAKLDWEGTWQNWVMREGPRANGAGHAAGSAASAPIRKPCPACGGATTGGHTRMTIGDVCHSCHSAYMIGTWDGKSARPRAPPPVKELL